MRSVLSLWWSLYWRFVLSYAALFAISTTFNIFFFTQTYLGLQFLQRHDEFIYWRPTASSWTMAALLWFIAAAAPQFLGSLVWDDRLRIGPIAWKAVGRTLALFFVALGILNLAFWKLTSTNDWIEFKVFAPLPLLAAALGLVSVTLRRGASLRPGRHASAGRIPLR